MKNHKTIASALYVINKHAKSKRDDINDEILFELGMYNTYTLREHMDRIYNLKNRVMEKLIKNKSMKYLGYSKSWHYRYGTTIWQCYKFCGISFHTKGEKKGKKLRSLSNISISADVNFDKSRGLTVSQAIIILEKFLRNS